MSRNIKIHVKGIPDRFSFDISKEDAERICRVLLSVRGDSKEDFGGANVGMELLSFWQILRCIISKSISKTPKTKKDLQLENCKSLILLARRGRFELPAF